MIENIHYLIKEYYNMQDGQHVENYLHEIIFSCSDIEIKITYRALKHIVEQRRRDNYSPERIYKLFEVLHTTLKNQTYRIIPNIELHNSFFLLESVFTRIDSICIVMELTFVDPRSYYIKTGFFRKLKKIKKFMI